MTGRTLGDDIGDLLTDYHGDPSDVARLAERADALERTLDGALEIAWAYREDHLAVERVRALADEWDRVHASGEDYHATDLRAALDGDS